MAYIKTNLGKLYYKPKILYVGIKQIDREVAFNNLYDVYHILKRHNLNVCPFIGTLLGIIRENNFIEWDEDIDLYILKEDEESLKNVLWDFVDNGFDVVRYERRGLYTIMRNNEYIDFYILHNITPTLRWSGGLDFVFEKYLSDTIEWDFKGIQVCVPREYEEFLTLRYGNWRTPVKYADFEIKGIKKLLSKSSYIIKNSLPDFLYYKMLHQYHNKDLKKFINECKKKSIKIPDNIIL